ncbi:MAG: acetyl-CoA hydrolase/transferase family protein [candidate division WOR-3 bacterium]|nr:MAG: acetyl-CoA hydrolase/transferase family protein [candidate division WOR-3 bacterium]
MSWFDEYKKKKCSFEEAVAVVKSNERVYISGNAATPFKLMEALELRHKELQNVEIAHVLLFGDDPLTKPGMEGHFRHNSLFVGPGDRKAVNEGKADYIPVFLYEIPSLFRSGLLPIDVAFMHLSPPDEHGFMSYGVECLASKAAAESAKKVVAMVNEKMPRALGDAFIHTSRVSKLVEVSIDLPELQPIPFTEVEKKIGANIAGLVEDGSTLQLGIGGIPNAALKAMFDKRDLGVHTEMVSDSIIEAIDAGVITGSKKTLHQGKVIATFFLGTKKLYEYIDNNPTFETHPAEYTNHPFIIGQNEKMVAINSAIEVDLTGQICSDSIGTRIYSGFGGQVDFIRGAAQSKGGKPIIALPSTAKGGKLSKIVPTLQVGAGVVTTRADVHYVVTEYGVAYLHGKNLRQRAEALIGISHPDFKESLTKAAEERKLL